MARYTRTVFAAATIVACSGVLPAGSILSNAGIAHAVAIRGTQRPLELETQSGAPIDSEALSRDVRKLWDTGWFDDVRVESTDTSEGADVVFTVKEKPVRYLRQVQVIGDGKAKPDIAPGARIDELQAHRVETAVARDLLREGYRDSVVRTEIVPAGPRQADLILHVDPGPKYVVGNVRFTGDLKLKESQLRDALEATKSRAMVPGLWKLRPPASDDGVQADANRLRALYASKGYFAADVSASEYAFAGERASVTYHIQAGPQYRIRNLAIQGVPAKAPSVLASGALPAKALCQCLMEARRVSERGGHMDFDAVMEVTGTATPRVVDVTLRVDPGPVYRLGRIDFRGHHSYGDATLRRAMKIDEGELFDWNRIHQSLERMNGLGLFRPLTPNDVEIKRNTENKIADMTIRVQQTGKGRWAFSGPVGPMSLSGPLQGSIVGRLPGWGRGLFELSTYYAVLSVTGFSSPLFRALSLAPQRDFVPYISLERPFLAGQEWLSGFGYAPQLGWRSTAGNYLLTQTHRRLRGLTAGRTALAGTIVAPLDLQLTGGSAGTQFQSPAALFCEAAKPRLHWARSVGTFVLDFGLGQKMF